MVIEIIVVGPSEAGTGSVEEIEKFADSPDLQTNIYSQNNINRHQQWGGSEAHFQQREESEPVIDARRGPGPVQPSTTSKADSRAESEIQRIGLEFVKLKLKLKQFFKKQKSSTHSSWRRRYVPKVGLLFPFSHPRQEKIEGLYGEWGRLEWVSGLALARINN